MNCPVCNQKYNCPCESCLSNFPNDLPKWITTNLSKDGNNWYESCPNCGLTQSVYDWMDESYKQYKKLKGVK